MEFFKFLYSGHKNYLVKCDGSWNGDGVWPAVYNDLQLQLEVQQVQSLMLQNAPFTDTCV